MKASKIADQVRRQIRRIPFLPGATSAQDVMDGPAQTVTDDALMRYITDEQRELAAHCKAMHVAPLITTWTGTDTNFPDHVRVLPSRVFRKDSGGNFIRCRRRTVGQHRMLESTGAKATPSHPTYTYEDKRLRVYPTGNDARVVYIKTPTKITALSNDLEVDERLELVMVLGVASRAEKALADEVPERMSLANMYDELKQQFIRPYLRTHRFGNSQMLEEGLVIDNREVSVE